MNYAEIKPYSIENGTGVRVSLFVSGCTHHCKECFNPETWNFSYGKPFTEETEAEILRKLEPVYITGLTLLGGEPGEPENQRGLLSLLRTMRERLPEKNVWTYTGYLYEDLISEDWVNHTIWTKSILDFADVIVDGPFILSQKDLRLRLCGSRNQRIIDMNKTRKRGELTIWKG